MKTYFDIAKENSLLDIGRLNFLDHAIIPKGCIVECGVCNGGSALILAQKRRELHLYDSFEGLPEPVEKDGERAKKCVGWHRGEVVKVKTVLCGQQYNLHIGLFHDTFRDFVPKEIALLHIDCDFYSAVKLCLETMVPNVVPNGLVVLDDYGCWKGCKIAVDEYLAKHGYTLKREGAMQAHFYKKVGSV